MSGVHAIRGVRLSASHPPCGSLSLGVFDEEVVLRRSGALWLPRWSTLVVADLHLEKGSAFAAKGQLLPPFDTAETLGRLEAELEALRPSTLILLGDSFHDARAMHRISAPDASRIQALASGRNLVWMVGNHDHGLLGVDQGERRLVAPGERAREVAIGTLRLRHEPLPGPAPGEVCGHLHPCAKLVRRGVSVRRRAFLTDGQRLILPAFGAYAGGLNARDRAFASLFVSPPIAAALGDSRVHAVAFEALSPD